MMFIVWALKDNAFQAGYKTCEEVLNPGTLKDSSNYTELR